MKENFQISPCLTIHIFKLKETISVNFALGFLSVYLRYVKFWSSFLFLLLFFLARDIAQGFCVYQPSKL